MPDTGIALSDIALSDIALPDDDTETFAEKLLAGETRTYRVAERERADVVFFGRGVPDVAAYLRLLGHRAGPHVEAAIALFRYRPRVFIAPPPAGREDFAECRRTYDAMAAAYAEYGYELVELPSAPVAERVEFVLANR